MAASPSATNPPYRFGTADLECRYPGSSLTAIWG
jgi:hypothetical protein